MNLKTADSIYDMTLLIDAISSLYDEGNINTLDQMIKDADAKEMSDLALVGFVRYTVAIREILPSWEDFRTRMFEEFKLRHGEEEARKVFGGLL